jgi:hypothetical protein
MAAGLRVNRDRDSVRCSRGESDLAPVPVIRFVAGCSCPQVIERARISRCAGRLLGRRGEGKWAVIGRFPLWFLRSRTFAGRYVPPGREFGETV